MLHPLTGQNIDPNEDQSDEPIDEWTTAWVTVSDLLMAIGQGLFLVFLAYAIVDSLPLALLNPRWQLGFVARLLSLGLIPVVGFICLHLASILNPANSLYRRRVRTVRQWAIIAAIGFLLLIPLQGFATWRAWSLAKSNQQTLIQRATKQVAPLKQAIESATSISDLQKKLARLQGTTVKLAEEDLSKPVKEVKQALLDGIARSETIYIDRISGPKPQQVWDALQAAVRTVLVSLGYGLAFAAGAQPGRSSQTLSDMMARRFNSLLGRRRPSRRAH
ncbi:MAG: hypothetical protein ER33_15265 [Cyanobium sp. CACIAM 14]|nr:MAG: hypothetical protein ER33_15265 [Cyanobium sp. CACIAM 14]